MSHAVLLLGEPLAVIGDVHGRLDRLQAAIESVIISNRRIVLVGDYIDRGPQSREVLDYLIDLSLAIDERLILLRGNHEVALLDFFASGDARKFLHNRGAATIRSYLPDPGPAVLKDFRRTFPAEHLNLIENMYLTAEGPDVFVSHAGFNPLYPDGRDEKDLTTGNWASLVAASTGPRSLVVVGHYVQPKFRPYLSQRLIGIDTGCGSMSTAPLTVLHLPERTTNGF